MLRQHCTSHSAAEMLRLSRHVMACFLLPFSSYQLALRSVAFCSPPAPSSAGVPCLHRTPFKALAVRSGADDRLRRIAQIKRLKEEGGNYEEMFKDKSVKQQQSDAGLDSMELLLEEEQAASKGVVGLEDFTEEDRVLYEELKRQEKRSKVQRLLQSKNIMNQPSAAQPVPYISKAPSSAAEAEERYRNVETYVPQSASWGRYTRPKNVREAFGGTIIPEGGVQLGGDKAWEAKYENLLAEAREYKQKTQGLKMTANERIDEEKIQEARSSARRSMLRGNYDQAVAELKPLQRICSVKSHIGAAVLMELAVAYEAIYEFDRAQEIYMLVRASPVRDLRTKAKALNLGAEAMKRLGLGSKSRVNPAHMPSFAYIPGQLEGSYGLYMRSRGRMDLEPKEGPTVETAEEAIHILEDAIIAQGVGVRTDLLLAALRAIHVQVLSADKVMGPMRGKSLPLSAEALDGRWRLRMKSHQEGLEFSTMASAEIWQRIDCANHQVTGRLPLQPFQSIRDLKSDFTWDPQKRVFKYGKPITSSFGLPAGKPHHMRVLRLEDTIMVATRCDGRGERPQESYENHFTVWTRAK